VCSIPTLARSLIVLGHMATALCALAACGRLEYTLGSDASVGPSDGGPGSVSDARIDGAVERVSDGGDAGADAMLGAFGPPVLVGAVSSPTEQEENPTLTDDLLELYFSSQRAGLGGGDIWVARRATAGADFGAPELVAELSTSGYDGSPEISRDGLAMWIATDRAGGLGSYDLWLSERTSRADTWPAPAPVAVLNSIDVDSSAVMNDAGDELWFHSLRSGQRELYRSTRTCAGWWCAPIPVDELNTTSDDTDPAISPDERTIFFTSARPSGHGDRDLWSASRGTVTAAFGAITNLDTLNSTAFDSDPWISSDLRVMFFTSSRAGTEDIYVATR
jgi:hypothetical protein